MPNNFRRPTQQRPRHQRAFLQCAQCGADPLAYTGNSDSDLMEHMSPKHGGQPLTQESVAQLRQLDRAACVICGTTRSRRGELCNHCEDQWYLDGDILRHIVLVLPNVQAFDTPNAQIGAERNQQKTAVIYYVADLDAGPPEWKSNDVRPLASVTTIVHGNPRSLPLACGSNSTVSCSGIGRRSEGRQAHGPLTVGARQRLLASVDFLYAAKRLQFLTRVDFFLKIHSFLGRELATIVEGQRLGTVHIMEGTCSSMRFFHEK